MASGVYKWNINAIICYLCGNTNLITCDTYTMSHSGWLTDDVIQEESKGGHQVPVPVRLAHVNLLP